MHRRDEQWRDHPVVDALTTPGTPEELADEQRFLAAFRAAVPVRRRRMAGRIGAGGSALVVALALSGGAAAAYTQSLPGPVQRLAHDAFAPLGVPAPKHHAATNQRNGSGGSIAAPGTSVSPSPTHSVAAAPHTTPSVGNRLLPLRPSSKVRTSRRPTVATELPSPTTSASPSPSTTPTPVTAPPVRPHLVTIVVSSSRVPLGSAVTVSGQVLSRFGQPVIGRRVGLIARSAAAPGWTRLAQERTADDGTVTFTVPAVDQSTALRLRTGRRVRSEIARVVVQPTVAVSPTLAGSTYTIGVTTTGAQPGDGILVRRHARGRWIVVAHAQLAADGTASLSLPAPQRHGVRYRLWLEKSHWHGAATTRFTLPPAAG
ncbi:MAG TPA: hypothetical protein VG708_02595 [Mycobacteriales bacterium]|nr:hypothetical protein [Mycobacteriales bacterium]